MARTSRRGDTLAVHDGDGVEASLAVARRGRRGMVVVGALRRRGCGRRRVQLGVGAVNAGRAEVVGVPMLGCLWRPCGRWRHGEDSGSLLGVGVVVGSAKRGSMAPGEVRAVDAGRSSARRCSASQGTEGEAVAVALLLLGEGVDAALLRLGEGAGEEEDGDVAGSGLGAASSALGVQGRRLGNGGERRRR